MLQVGRRIGDLALEEFLAMGPQKDAKKVLILS